MANWNYDPRITANSNNPEIKKLQQTVMDMARELRMAMRELDEQNISPEYRQAIENTEEQPIQPVKNKTPNAYIGADGEIFKIVGGAGGTGGGDPLSMMPVGYVYMSTSSTSPQTLFGGTWRQLKDVFLLAAGDTYTAGSKGGEATHTLTTDEMPAHTHDQSVVGARSGSGSTYVSWNASNLTGSSASSYNKTFSTGGGKAHNNMPPYLAVYAWERTA